MACLERETRGAISPVHVPLGLPPAPLARAWAGLSAPSLARSPLSELLPVAWGVGCTRLARSKRAAETGGGASGVHAWEQRPWQWAAGGPGAPWVLAGPHRVLSGPLLLSSIPLLLVPQVDEAQRRMDAEIWQLLSSFAAHPPAPPQRISPHPQPAAALQAAPPSSPFSSSSSSAFSASLSSAVGSQVRAKSPTKGLLLQAPCFTRLQLSLNQRHKFCPFLHPTWTDIYSNLFFFTPILYQLIYASFAFLNPHQNSH